MVVPLGPGKFYGTSLPRPRIYTDVKLNDQRIDPPVPVLDPLLSWANEAHWSMGGLSFKRLRLQGRIEGSVKKLQAEREKLVKKNNKILAGSSARSGSTWSDKKRAAPISPPPAPIAKKRRRFMALINEDDDDDDSSAEEKEEVGDVAVPSRGGVKRRLVKRLGDDFDRVASEAEKRKRSSSPLKGLINESEGVALRTRPRSRKMEEEDDITETLMKVVEEVKMSTTKGKKVKGDRSKGKKGNGGNGSSAVSGVRTSPRLAKRG